MRKDYNMKFSKLNIDYTRWMWQGWMTRNKSFCFLSHWKEQPGTCCQLEYKLLKVRQLENAITLFGLRSCPGAEYVTMSHPSSFLSQFSPEKFNHKNFLLKLHTNYQTNLIHGKYQNFSMFPKHHGINYFQYQQNTCVYFYTI